LNDKDARRFLTACFLRSGAHPVRRQWSLSMALEKIEYGPQRKFVVGDGFRLPNRTGLIAIAAAPALVLLLLIPLPLVPPVLSLLSFVIACGAALYAFFTNAGRDAHGVTIWNFAGAFTLVWIVAGVMSKPRYVLGWFDHLSMVP
jgi:hypothetical protein